MDIMLYIIAGLVLILLIAVLVLRKNKAQKPLAQRPIKAGKNAAANAAVSTLKADRSSTAQGDPNNANKFDSITVAQRFIDQQSYDKAIGALERGLIEKPQDNQLLLKLLSVYATINQPDDFYRIYDSIKAYSDAATVKQADELKSLLVEEENQAAARVASLANETNSGEFESLDFDLLTTQTIENSASPAVATSSSEQVRALDEVSPTNNNIDRSFNLTFGDLESTSNSETDEIDSDLEINDLKATAAGTVVTNIPPISQSESVTDDHLNTNDFNVDFETPAQANLVQAENDNRSLEEISLDGDDFVLDFADLVTDTDFDRATSVDSESNAAIESPVKINEYDFTLSLDSDEALADVYAITEDNALENSRVISTTPSTFDDTPLIDDNIFIDDNFDTALSLATETTPVESEDDSATGANMSSVAEHRTESASDDLSAETPADFASRFAADFDFVKTLDSNQVTLDLAGQYLQLGEYDSAKRLLNEVMTQGNDQQQNQAQVLLKRMA